jgi:hypothetical protein
VPAHRPVVPSCTAASPGVGGEGLRFRDIPLARELRISVISVPNPSADLLVGEA